MSTVRRRVAGFAAVAIVLAAAQGITSTNASWLDSEWDHGDVRALQCVGNTDLSSRATSRMFTGMTGSTELETLVGISGLTVTNDGTTTSAVAGTPGAVSLGADAYDAPLSATSGGTALRGTSVSVPLDNGVGVYEQWAQAHDTGVSTGAAGAVTNTGAIDTGAIDAGTAPTVGSLALSSLPLVGAPLSGLSDVGLTIGAVASSATLDGCSLAWSGGAPSSSQLQRAYSVSTLEAQLSSAAVASLFGATGTVPTLVSGAQTQLGSLFGTNSTTGTAESGIAASALTALTSAVTSALGSIHVAGISVAVGTGGASSTTVLMDLSTVSSLLTGVLVDSAGGVSVDLASGAVTIDAAKQLPGGLNGQPANTDILTAAQLATAASRVGALLNARITAVNAALLAALNAATVTVQADVTVAATVPILFPSGVAALNVYMGYTGTIAQFAAGTETVSGPTVSALPGLGLISGLLSAVTTPLTANLGAGLGVTTSVAAAVFSQAVTPITSTAASLLSMANAAAATTLTALSGSLAALSSVLSITLNSQPDRSPSPPFPVTAPQPNEYFVSALHIGMLDSTVSGATSLLSLFLATSSVGPNAQ